MSDTGSTSGDERRQVTRLLREWRSGDAAAIDQLMPLVYPELRRIAQRAVRAKRGEQTLQATGLVHEAFLKMVGAQPDWQDRNHFYAAAAQTMRHVLVDYFRSQQAAKRGGANVHITLHADSQSGAADFPIDRLEALLCELDSMDPRKCRIAEMHYFAGLDYEEIASVLDVSRSTVARELRFTKSWLSAALAADND